jgi:hypothetical protein
VENSFNPAWREGIINTFLRHGESLFLFQKLQAYLPDHWGTTTWFKKRDNEECLLIAVTLLL